MKIDLTEARVQVSDYTMIFIFSCKQSEIKIKTQNNKIDNLYYQRN